MLPVCLEGHLLGLDVNDFGVYVYFLTGGEDVCLISYGGFDDGCRWGVTVGRENRAK